MINGGFLKKQLVKSSSGRSTSRFLRGLTLAVVDRSLRQRYGENYSIRCLQGSVGVSQVLQRLGIGAKVMVGEVCVPQVSVKNGRVETLWAGFWEPAHHVFVVTEYGEIVDLTIGQLHIHPVSAGSEVAAMPPVWWSDPVHLPTVMSYLPGGEPDLRLPDDEAVDLASFKVVVGRTFEATLAGADPSSSLWSSPLLEAPPSLFDLLGSGDPWAVGAVAMERSGMPFPARIQAREAEMAAAFDARTVERRQG